VETADSGGWDECFPTVAPCPVPGAPPGTPLLPDHGELWGAPWISSVYDSSEGTTLAGSAKGTVFPYEFHRQITLDPQEPVVRFRYLLRHTGDRPFPWIWSAHPLLNVQPGSVLTLPGVSQVKLAAVHGRGDPSLGSGQAPSLGSGQAPSLGSGQAPSRGSGQVLHENDVVSWPGAIGGKSDRFTFPEHGGWALKACGDLGSDGRMMLTDPRMGERLELVVRREEVPQVGVWINCRGWAPPGRTPVLQHGAGAVYRSSGPARSGGDRVAHRADAAARRGTRVVARRARLRGFRVSRFSERGAQGGNFPKRSIRGPESLP